MRRLGHDRVLGKQDVLGADPLHGPLEQRDRRIRTLKEARRSEHLLRGPGDGLRKEKRN